MMSFRSSAGTFKVDMDEAVKADQEALRGAEKALQGY